MTRRSLPTPPGRLRRRWAGAVVLLVAALGVVGCDSGGSGEDGSGEEGPGSALLTEEDMGAGFRAVEEFPDLVEDPSCRVDPPSLFPGRSAETTAVFEGGRQTFLVGAWKQRYESYRRANRVMADRVVSSRRACATADLRNGSQIPLNVALPMNLTGSETEYFRGEEFETPTKATSLKFYTWGDGWVITAWAIRRGDTAPDADEVARVLNMQVEKLVEEVGLDQSNYSPGSPGSDQ